MTTPKMTLAFPYTFDPFTITVQELMSQPCGLHDRAVCETDFTLLQPILYMTLVDTSGPVPKYFVYVRGKASGEQRLAGKCSIGIGGHTEEFSVSTKYHITSAVAHALAEGGSRELMEEVGLSISELEFVKALLNQEADTTTESGIIIYKPFILYSPITDVDKVHIGISIGISCTPDQLGSLEEGIITRGEWLTIVEIEAKEAAEESPIELETWSKTVLANIMSKTA